MDPEEITDEEFQTAIEAQGALLCVFAIDGDRGVSDIIDLAGMEGAAELVGKTLSFETTDLDGNAVKSEDLFAQHELTMVNIWTTWCGPCKGELAGLGEMNRRLAEKDAAVEGAMVQFCSDDACMVGKTDANGVAAFEVEEGRSYTVHILKTPEGYEKNDEELTVQDVSNTVSVVLRNAA